MPHQPPPGAAQLDLLRAARAQQSPLPGLEPASYARDHAAFEACSDQRRLIGEHLTGRLLGGAGGRRTGPVSVLSAGCGDGSLDAPLAAALADVEPARDVRYVGLDPWAGSTSAFAAALGALDRPRLSTQVHTAAFDDVPLVGSFDVVTFVHSMYYVPHVAVTLKTAYDLLAPGGELLVLSAPRAELNALVGVLAPPLEGHRQWFSDDVAVGFAEAGLEPDVVTLAASLDLRGAGDEVVDFAVQARLTPDLRPLVAAYLDAVSVPGASGPRVPHPVDVYRVLRPL